jgi:hypothetical protein
MQTATGRKEIPPLLNVFCMKEGDAWRVHVAPDWMPPELERLFDYNGEAYPVLLDWEDLERHMETASAQYEVHFSCAGSVELTAHGAEAAATLARWFATALSSGIRMTEEDDVDLSEPAAG